MPFVTNPPENYIVTERYLNTVLTTGNISDMAKPFSIVVSDREGKIDDGWLNVSNTSVAEGIPKSGSDGKIDTSWLYTTNESPANSVVVTDYNGKIPNIHINGSVASVPNGIPVAGPLGKLDNSWLNASVLSNMGRIPIADDSGKIDNSYLPVSVTSSPASIPLSNSNGKIDTNYLKASSEPAPNSVVLTNSSGKISNDLLPSTYLPLAGGTMTGNINFSDATGGEFKGIVGNVSAGDKWRVSGTSNTTGNGFVEIATSDNMTVPIYARQYQGADFTGNTRTLTLMDASGNTTLPGTVKVSGSNVILGKNNTGTDINIQNSNGALRISGGSGSNVFTFNTSNKTIDGNVSGTASYATNAGNVNISGVSESLQESYVDETFDGVAKIKTTITNKPDSLTSGGIWQIVNKLMSRCHYHEVKKEYWDCYCDCSSNCDCGDDYMH